MAGERTLISIALTAGLVMIAPGLALAHCDALDGPVVTAARRALEQRDVTLVLPWVQPDGEGEVRQAFDRALRVRALGSEAQSLSDRWFFETLVRIHRAGEGAPFEGLKPAGAIDPILSAADRALEAGNADALVADVAARAADGVRERFARARDAKASAGVSVGAGRRYVAAYVEYLHYVEGLHRSAAGAGGSHDAPAAAATHEH